MAKIKRICEEENGIQNGNLHEQAAKILTEAESKGLSTNFFFSTTFARYVKQLEIMERLNEALEKEGTLVTKVYVKGRENLVANPAISEYNKTSTAANNTINTLIGIIKGFSDLDGKKETKTSKFSGLIDRINGIDD